MIKSVSIEQKFFDRCILQKPPHCGIVVGGVSKEEECVFFLVKSKEVADVAKGVEAIDGKELLLQCRKIVRMLPAGVRISGLYYAGLNFNTSQSNTCVKKLLAIVSESENSTQPEYYEMPVNDKLFLHVDPSTKKIVAKAINPNEPKDFFRPIDVKVRPVIDRWMAIKTHITLSLETHLPADRQREKILEHLKLAAAPYLQAISKETRLLINNTIRRSDDNVFAIRASNTHKTTGSKEKHSKRNTITKEAAASSRHANEALIHSLESLEFTLFGPNFPLWQRTNSCSSIDSGHSSDNLGNQSPALSASSATTSADNDSSETSDKNLFIHGRIPGIAFLPLEGTSVGDALVAFRRDLVRSILIRLELLAEELHVTSGQMEASRVTLPQRVLIHIPVCPTIPLSDYKFISETLEDVVKRVSMFCQPLGSPITREFGDSMNGEEGDGSNTSGNCSDSGLVPREPVFNVSCLDTRLEQTFEGSGEDEISDVEIIEEISGIAHTVSKSKGKILTVGAIGALFLACLIPIYFELWSL